MITENIISHNCVGGRIYQRIEKEYGNPFMWCVIPPDDFYYLYTHYNEINFNNIKLEKEGTDYKIIVDEKVTVYYVHYKYKEDASTPIIRNGIDVYYNKMDKYVIDKYRSRLTRMKDKPLFIVTDREFFKKTECNFQRDDLIKYVGKDDCIIVTCDRSIIGENVVYVENKNMDPKEIAEILVKEPKWGMEKKINICIVHHNTPELTECLIKSINKQVQHSEVKNIYIFDNSDKRPFTYRQDNIRYIDNTKGQIINFNEWGKNYPYKREPFYSSKHCYTVQTFIDMVNEPFFLMDSDILLKRDITGLWDEKMGYVGASSGNRILPFICFINPKVLKEKGISYFDDRYTYDLNKDKCGTRRYDTGYTLWANKDVLPHKDIDCKQYIVHYAGGSYDPEWFNVRHKGQIKKEDWLKANMEYWSNEVPEPKPAPKKPAPKPAPKKPSPKPAPKKPAPAPKPAPKKSPAPKPKPKPAPKKRLMDFVPY